MDKQAVFDIAVAVVRCPVEGCSREWGSAPSKRQLMVRVEGVNFLARFECCNGPKYVTLNENLDEGRIARALMLLNSKAKTP